MYFVHVHSYSYIVQSRAEQMKAAVEAQAAQSAQQQEATWYRYRQMNAHGTASVHRVFTEYVVK
jgi:multidrug resistance efflux pump